MNMCSNCFPHMYLHAHMYFIAQSFHFLTYIYMALYKLLYHLPLTKPTFPQTQTKSPLSSIFQMTYNSLFLTWASSSVRCPAAAWPKRSSDTLREMTAPMHSCCAMAFTRCYYLFLSPRLISQLTAVAKHACSTKHNLCSRCAWSLL